MPFDSSTSGPSVGADPVARKEMLAVRMTQAKQHQLVAGRQMQREPVPAVLVRRQRLAAPFAIDPALSGDGDSLAVEHRASRTRAGTAGCSNMTPGPARTCGCSRPRLAAPRRARSRGEAHRKNPLPTHGPRAAQNPPSYRATAACQSSIHALNGAASTPACPTPPRAKRSANRCVSRLVIAACAMNSCRLDPAFVTVVRLVGLPEQRPLHAIACAGRVLQVRGDVPPLDPELRMRAVIGGKSRVVCRGQPAQSQRRRRRDRRSLCQGFGRGL